MLQEFPQGVEQLLFFCGPVAVDIDVREVRVPFGLNRQMSAVLAALFTIGGQTRGTSQAEQR